MVTNKEEIVKKILLTPIVCDKKYKSIQLVDGIICSPQKYIRYADCDMSDFSVGFYEVIYKDIIPDKKLLDSGHFINKEFAGDTINSFNTLANIILGDKNKESRSPRELWDDYLIDYKRDYHCLANFWVIPMRHGRTSAKLTKYDSLDCYLKLLNNDYESFKIDEFIKYPHDDEQYENYFRIIDSYDKFIKVHSITGHIIADDPIEPYKNKDKEKCRLLIESIYLFMEERADSISKKYTDELYDYFKSLGII